MNKKLYKLFFTVCVFLSLSAYSNPSNIYEALGVPPSAEGNEMFTALGTKEIRQIQKSLESLSFYQRLGVPKTASQPEIKTAYRGLAKKFHPDTNKTNSQLAGTIFQLINEAYETLKDAKKRESYDRFGNSAREYSQTAQDPQTAQNPQTNTRDFFQQTFKDIFNERQNSPVQNTEELKPYESRAVKLFYQFSFFKKDTSSFLEGENRYLNLLKKKQNNSLLTKQEKAELNRYRVQNLKDLELFKRILSSMGLSAQALPAVFFESYLDGLKNEWHDRNRSKGLLAELSGPRKGSTSAATPLLSEIEVRKALTLIKSHFDTSHFEGLKKGSNPFNKNFLKSFPAQFLVFHLALGSSIYLHALYDKQISGYEKHPEELNQVMQQSLTGSGMLSFAIFVAMMQQVHYRVYGFGRFMDGKTVLGKHFNGKLARSLAPSLGLGMGFFTSTVVSDLWHDPYFSSCLREQFKDNEGDNSASDDYMSACGHLYLNWKAGEKWKIYAVDIVSILGSSIISHKLISSLFKYLNRTMIGYNALILLGKKLGPQVIRGGNFFINLLAFLEVHTLLENWAGEPIKKQLISEGVEDDLSDISGLINAIKVVPNQFWKLQAVSQNNINSEETISNLSGNPEVWVTKSLKNLISRLGHRFKLWNDEVNKHYQNSYHLWLKKLNSSLIDYESSLPVLKNLFLLSQFDYNKEWNDDLTLETFYEEQEFSEEKELFLEKLGFFLNKNTSSYFFKNDILADNKDLYKQKYCDIVSAESNRSELTELTAWKKLCGGGDEFIDKLKMLKETSWIIFSKLKQMDLQKADEIKAENYISLDKNEIFSSKPEFSIPSYRSAPNMSEHIFKRAALAKQMIKTGLKEDPLSGFDSFQMDYLKKQKAIEYFSDNEELSKYFLQPSYYSEQIKGYCTSEYPDRIEICQIFFKTSGEANIKADISLKFLTAGMYLLQGIMSDVTSSDFMSFFTSVPFRVRLLVSQLLNIEDLIGLFEVYKKGERSFREFIKFIESVESAKNSFKNLMNTPLISFLAENSIAGNPYFVLYNLVCGAEKSGGGDSFSIPQLSDFSEAGEKIKIYNFESNAFVSLNSVCKTFYINEQEDIHDLLFDRPTVYKEGGSDEKNYENLYLVLEQVIRTSYNKFNDLMSAYHDLSKDQLDNISKDINHDLSLLINQFYKQTIDKDFNISYIKDKQNLVKGDEGDQNDSAHQIINQDLLNYYDENKVYFNWCVLAKDLTKGLSQALFEKCEEGFKKLTASIFQVNYFLKTFKELLIKGQEIKVCDNDEDDKDNSNGQCQTLNKRFLNVNRIEGFDQMRSKLITSLQIIHDCYKDNQSTEECKISEKEFESLFSKVIFYVYSSTCNKDGRKCDSRWITHLLMIQQNQVKVDSRWEKLIYSVLFEINKSLKSFFIQLQPLHIKDEFNKEISLSEAIKIH